jgi:uncharacterized protein YcfL
MKKLLLVLGIVLLVGCTSTPNETAVTLVDSLKIDSALVDTLKVDTSGKN